MTAKTTLWMCVALAAAILAAWLVVVLATPTKRAEAAFPGKNGKIAFQSQLGDSDSEIFTMKANGDNKSVLTNNRADDYDPTFSPDGRKIAFASTRAGNSDIFTMSANATDKKRVTTSAKRDWDPAWSPNGTRIAFVSQRHGGNRDIYVINKDGTGLTRLTTSPKMDSNPAWSPDGTRIAFDRGTPNRDLKIYVMKAKPESKTNIPKRLTTSESGDEVDPAWSPDGTRIAFASNQGSPPPMSEVDPYLTEFDLYTIRADGSDQIRLTTTSIGHDPAWSPDGTKIAFWSMLGTTVPPTEIFVMKAAPESETNRPKQITSSPRGDFSPDWQPLR